MERIVSIRPHCFVLDAEETCTPSSETHGENPVAEDVARRFSVPGRRGKVCGDS